MHRAGLILLATVAIPPAMADEGWRTYANARFGTIVDYPSRFTDPDPEPENGDGRRFRTPDRRASLAAWGSFRTERETPREMMKAARDAGVRYTYAVADGRGYTLSGLAGERVTYRRCVLSGRSSDVVGCVEMDYPAAEARAWDAIVSRVARSLRFGRSG